MAALRTVRRARTRRSAGQVGETTLFVPLSIAIWHEEGKWLSECIELGIGSFGDNPDDAAEEAMDAVTSYLNTLEELGERDRVFAEKSILTYMAIPAEVPMPALPRALAERDGLQIRPFEVPIVLTGAGSTDAPLQ